MEPLFHPDSYGYRPARSALDAVGVEGGWRPFKATRAFVHRLKPKLKNQKEWFVYAKSEKKPHDIPKSPNSVCANDGWVSWGDWLGTGQGPRRLAFARGLKLKSHTEWAAYCKSEKRPATS